MKSFPVLGLAVACLPLASAQLVKNAPPLAPATIFSVADDPGAVSVHLPSLLVTKSGAVIAVCQARKASSSDWNHQIDLLERRSEDGGRSWGPVQLIFHDSTVNAINGPIVEDTQTGTLVLPFTQLPVDVDSQAGWVQYFAKRGGSAWTMTSQNEGKTWSPPVESHPQGADGWIAWPGNSVHGVQLSSGRLVIEGMAHQNVAGDVYHALDLSACLLYSDDHGRSWRIGAVTDSYGTDESTIATCSDGSLFMSVRFNDRTPHDLVRLIERSRDGGQSFSDTYLLDHMSICACHAGMTSFWDHSQGKRRFVMAYSGPQGGDVAAAHPDRTHLAIRISFDDGKIWGISRLIASGKVNTEYSDLAVAPDGQILCLYGVNTFEKTGSRIELVRLPLSAIQRDYSPLRN